MAAAIALAAGWTAVVIDSLARTADAPDSSMVLLRQPFTVPTDARPWLIAVGVASVVLAWTLVVRASIRRRTAHATSTAETPHDRPPSVSPARLRPSGVEVDPGSITSSRVAEMQIRIEELQDRLRTVLADRVALRTELATLRRELERAESGDVHAVGPAGSDEPAATSANEERADRESEESEDAEVIVLEDVSGSSARAVFSRVEAGESAGRGEIKEPS